MTRRARDLLSVLDGRVSYEKAIVAPLLVACSQGDLQALEEQGPLPQRWPRIAVKSIYIVLDHSCRVLAKAAKEGGAPSFLEQIPFDVVRNNVQNHKYALI